MNPQSKRLGSARVFRDFREKFSKGAAYYRRSLTLTAQLVVGYFAPCPENLRRRRQQINQQIYQQGVQSLPIVVIATVFAGMVLTFEIAWHLNLALTSVQMVPGFSGQFIIRELAIAIPAFLVIARVGAAITAEVATMKITDQLDALKLLHIDFIEYVVFPRFVATLVSLVTLTTISIAVTLFFAMLIAVFQFGFTFSEYVLSLQNFIDFKDLFSALIKSLAYGSVIPVISCTIAVECKGGAEGVGQATTQSVVSSTLAVIFLDFILTYLFSTLLF